MTEKILRHLPFPHAAFPSLCSGFHSPWSGFPSPHAVFPSLPITLSSCQTSSTTIQLSAGREEEGLSKNMQIGQGKLLFFLFRSQNCCSDQFILWKAMNHQIMAGEPRGVHACSKLSRKGSNPDPPMDCHPGVSQAGWFINVCAVSLMDMKQTDISAGIPSPPHPRIKICLSFSPSCPSSLPPLLIYPPSPLIHPWGKRWVVFASR